MSKNFSFFVLLFLLFVQAACVQENKESVWDNYPVGTIHFIDKDSLSKGS